MSISIQEYIVRLREIYESMEALNDTGGRLPAIQEQLWMEILERAFQAVPELEQSWSELGTWVDTMTTMLEDYHTLASQLLQEEDTAKFPSV